MAVHTDTKPLITYSPNNYPIIQGGESQYITSELAKVAKAINKLVEVTKMLEARMNTNGLT